MHMHKGPCTADTRTAVHGIDITALRDTVRIWGTIRDPLLKWLYGVHVEYCIQMMS